MQRWPQKACTIILFLISNLTFLTAPALANPGDYQPGFNEEIQPVRVMITTRFFLKSSPDSLPLTKATVRNFIRTRIATAKLQRNMQAHAGEYDDLIHTYYKKRETLLKERGWTVKKFEAVRDHISAVSNALDEADDLASSKKDHEKEVAKIKANKYFSSQKKKQIIDLMNNMRESRRKNYIDPYKSDWPAVHPYRKKLKQFDDWYSGNIPNPPKIND